MSSPITISICGLGVRGFEVYAAYASENPHKVRVAAVADISKERLAQAKELFSLSDNMCFESAEALLAHPKLSDALVVATQDRQHVAHALAAIEKGYHLLLEKPISPSAAECVAVAKSAREHNRIVAVAHVLRYTEIFGTVKELIQKGEIGRIMNIDLIENVAYWHFAHSYVRGNWRQKALSSPMIMAKSCHDLDILRWLAGEECLSLSSAGALSYFTHENMPSEASSRCISCKLSETCPYSAVSIYIKNSKTGIDNGNAGWPCSVLAKKPTPESIREALSNGPYGKCVFCCDNDVADHQSVCMRFKNDICATFTVTAFTAECFRNLKVMGTTGEIEIDMLKNIVYLTKFGQEKKALSLDALTDKFAGHGGGDGRMMDSFCALLQSGESEALTSVDVSVESHIMALAAEQSRLNGGECINLKSFVAKL